MLVGRPMRTSDLLGCVALVLAACVPQSQQQQPTFVDTSGRGAPPGGRPIRHGAVNALPPSPEAGFRVARSPEDWGGGQPPVDFGQAMVLVASAGMSPTGGYAMNVRNVTEAAGEVHVEVEHRAPGQNCPVPQSAEWVGQVVALERVEAPVRFHVARVQAPPCVDPPVAAVRCWAEGSEHRAQSLHVPERAAVVCDGSESRTDGGRGGPPASGSWELVSAPEGSTVPTGTLGQGPQARLQPDVPGAYVVRLTIADAQGTTATSDATIHAGPIQQNLEATVSWSSPGGGDGAATGGPLALKILRGSRGCYLGSRSLPVWCEIEPVSADDPNAGAVARLPAERARGEFLVAVDYPEGNQPDQAVAQIQLKADGVVVGEWRDAEARAAGDRWEVATVEMPAGTITR